MRRLTKSRKSGLSLLEVMVALTILGTSLIGMAEYGRKFANTNQKSRLQNIALDIATERLERVKSERNYTSMDTLAGTHSVTQDGITFTRTTTILLVASSQVNYKIVTVSVNRATMTKPVKKTSAVARF